MNRIAAFLLLFVALTGCASTVPPVQFSELDVSSSTDIVVVVTARHGGILPPFAECNRADVICMDPPPFWFRVRVLDAFTGHGFGTTRGGGQHQSLRHGGDDQRRRAEVGSSAL